MLHKDGVPQLPQWATLVPSLTGLGSLSRAAQGNAGTGNPLLQQRRRGMHLRPKPARCVTWPATERWANNATLPYRSKG